MCNEIHNRLAALERRVGVTEAAVTLPGNIDLSGSSQIEGGYITIGEAVEANGQVRSSFAFQYRW